MKIDLLARRMINWPDSSDKDINIEYTGLRPGEKCMKRCLATKRNDSTVHEKIRVAKVTQLCIRRYFGGLIAV